MSDRSPTAPPERPSRYSRSFGGLLAAMLVTLVFVAAYVGFRAVFRDQPSGRPDPVDYLSSVSDLQQADVPVVYPRDLPTGWVADSVEYDRGTHPQWTIGMVTDAGDFLGIAQQDAPVDDLLHAFVDDAPTHGRDATVQSELGSSWATWSDAGGDHAFSTTLTSGAVAGQTLLVYGSAPVKELEQLVQLLTTEPVHHPGA